MRKAMGNLYSKEGYFHIESLLNPGLPAWTQEELDTYAELHKAVTILGDVELVFWLIHPLGFGLILRKTSEIAHSQDQKLEALERMGEVKLAQRWREQMDEGAKRLSMHHATKRDYITSMHHNLAEIVKNFKQRISVSYNRRHDCVGTIWRERAKAFHLPNESQHLSEVAAFILAQAELLNSSDCLNRPGTVAEVRSGQREARQGLGQIMQTTSSAPKQLERLLRLRKDVLEKAGTRIKHATRRGKPAAWRPECERNQ